MQVASACFIQPPLCYVGLTEEEARQKLEGDIDVYVSKFKPMKNTLSGRDEKTLMKLIVHVNTDEVRSLMRGKHNLFGSERPESLYWESHGAFVQDAVPASEPLACRLWSRNSLSMSVPPE